MKRISILFLLTAFFICCFTGQPSQSQIQSAPEKFNVFVHVKCRDEVTKTLIESYIKRELRNLRDVLINQNTLATHTLMVNALELERAGIGKTGAIAISAIYTEVIYPYHLLNAHLSREKYMDIAADLVATTTFPLSFDKYCQSFLTVGATEDLPSFCRNIVAAFDTTTLEKERQKK